MPSKSASLPKRKCIDKYHHPARTSLKLKDIFLLHEFLLHIDVNECGNPSRKKRYAWWGPVTSTSSSPTPSKFSRSLYFKVVTHRINNQYLATETETRVSGPT